MRLIFPEQTPPESSDCSANYLLLPRPEIDIKILELPSAGRNVRPLLQLKIAGLYPGSPEDTIFDYSVLGRQGDEPNRAILFISRQSRIEHFRSLAANVSFFLPYSLVRRFLKRSGIQTAVCTFWWTGWRELLVFDRGRLVMSRVFEGSESPLRFARILEALLPKEHQLAPLQAPHIIFCNEQDRTALNDSVASIRPLPDQILSAERLFRDYSRLKDSLFATRRSVLGRYGGVAAAAVFLVAALIGSVFADRRIQRLDDEREALKSQTQKVLEVKSLLQRLEGLEAEHQALAGRKPVNPYLLLQRLAEIFGNEPDVLQLVLDETRRILLDGRSEEPFALLAKLEDSDWFSSLQLSHIIRDTKGGKERFNLSGVYHDR
jgi:hypothetical protein